MTFWRMRWNSIGSSAAGLSAYFSASLNMASWTTSSAESSSRMAYTACLNARRSTDSRKSESSCREAINHARAAKAVDPSRVLALTALLRCITLRASHGSIGGALGDDDGVFVFFAAD